MTAAFNSAELPETDGNLSLLPRHFSLKLFFAFTKIRKTIKTCFSRTMSRWLLDISKERGCTAFFGQSVPVLGNWKNISWCSDRTSCNSVHGSCPVTGSYWKDLAFFAARTHCLLTFNLVSIRTPDPFLSIYFPDDCPPTNSHAQDYYFPGERLCTSAVELHESAHLFIFSRSLLITVFLQGRKKHVRIGSFSKPLLLYFLIFLEKALLCDELCFIVKSSEISWQ